MPKLNLATALRIKDSTREFESLKGPGGILWTRTPPVGGSYAMPTVVQTRAYTFSNGGIETLPYPAGMTAGPDRLLLLFLTWEDDPSPVVQQAPEELILSGEVINPASAQASAQLWYREIDGTEGSGVDFDFDTGRDTTAYFVEMRDWDNTVPPTISFFDSNASAQTTFQLPEHTWPWPNDTRVFTGFSADNDRTDVDDPLGFGRITLQNARNWFGLFDKEVPSGNSEDPTDIAVTGGDSTYVGFTAAVAGRFTGPDVTAPVAFISSVSAGDGQLTVGWTTDTNEGTARIVAVPNGDPDPSATEILAGQANGGGAAAGDSGAITVTFDGVQTDVTITGLTNGTSYDLHLVHEDAAGNAATEFDDDHTPVVASDPFRVLHFRNRILNSGGSQAVSPPVGSVNNAFVLTNGGLNQGTGDVTSPSSSKAPDDTGVKLRLTAANNVEEEREFTGGSNEASYSLVEYQGAAGGPDEFIVRDRRTITLDEANPTATYTPGNLSSIVNADKCIIVTSVSSDRSNSSNFDHAAAGVTIDRTTGEVGVMGRGPEVASDAGVLEVHLEVVEMTGSNWTVHYGSVVDLGDTGTITLTGSVAAWNRAFIIHHMGKNGGGNGNIADMNATYGPGAALNEVVWAFNSGHDGSAGQQHTVFVLEHAGMTVTRYQQGPVSGTSLSDIDITTAGLTDLSKSLCRVSANSTGTGSANPRGNRIASLPNLTTFRHECGRNGQTMEVEMQVARLP